MKKCNKLFLAMLFFTSCYVSAQTTVHFKPNATQGEDALIWELNGNCVPGGYPATPANMNFGNSSLLYIDAWTWGSFGCSAGTQRSYIRFAGLNSLPPNAYVISADLILKTPQTTYDGNSYYPGSTFPTNPGWVKRVNAGVSNQWTESSITWNNASSITTSPSNIVTIPVSTAKFNTTTTLNVTGIVQDIVSDINASVPAANNGFFLQLQTESKYRRQDWGSSDYSDSTYWPELVVTYEVCDPSFTYCSNSNNPFQYTFSANAGLNTTYYWSVDGTNVGNGPGIIYTFPGPGSYHVCLTTSNKYSRCERCIDFCIPKNDTISSMKISNGTTTVVKNREYTMEMAVLHGDDINKIIQKPLISPNPTNSGWNIELNENVSGKINITLYGNDGRQLKSFTKKLNKENRLYLGAEDLKSGVYIIKIIGSGITYQSKVIKN